MAHPAATGSARADASTPAGTNPALDRSDARLRRTEQLVGVGTWEVDLDRHGFTYSSGFERVMGLDSGETLDLEGCVAMIHPEDRDAVSAAAQLCLDTGSARCECRIMRPDAVTRIVRIDAERVDGDEGASRHIQGAIHDITDERQRESERLAALALFEKGFDSAPIGMVITEPGSGRYLRVNDAMCRMLGRSRQELLTLTIHDVTHAEHRSAIDVSRQAMLEGQADSYQDEKRYLRGDGSAAWAMLHCTPIHEADGSVGAFFSQVVDIGARKAQEARVERYVQDAVWLGRIRDALDEDRLLLYAQPIVDLRTGRTVQRELLLRMRDESGAVIAPGAFLPVAERYGLISELDRWVISQAVRLAADENLPTQFNLSGASVGDPDVLRVLASELEATGADPRLLTIEITETALLKNPEAGRQFARQVAELGCGIALDDFGTGFASLTSLKCITADHLKIDMEFVQHLTGSEDDQRLVRGIVGFAREFHQTTTAEGIEDEATLVLLRQLGVDRGQGYLFGRPTPLLEGRCRPRMTPAHSPGCEDPVGVVRDAFAAFGRRDFDAAAQHCHPLLVLRPYTTAARASRVGPYRGHAGLQLYMDDVGAVWDDLIFTPTAFWNTGEAVVAFGHVLARTGDLSAETDVLWVCRVRDGRLTSVDVFQYPDGEAPAAHA